jgi:hypothetical protein
MKVTPFYIKGVFGGLAKTKGIVMLSNHSCVFQFSVAANFHLSLFESDIKEVEIPFSCISHLEYRKPMFNKPQLILQLSDLNLAAQFPKHDRGQIVIQFDKKHKKLAKELLNDIKQSITDSEIHSIIKQADNIHSHTVNRQKIS